MILDKYLTKSVHAKSKGFTLTEVLLAVGIVGVIAALVLPAVITHYSIAGLDAQERRQVDTISSAIEGLAINENKVNFGETMMYSNATPASYEDSSGKFLKKYLRVARYFGDYKTNKATILSEGFGKVYYSYEPGKAKSEYMLENELSGACALLKNGVSICLKPQIGGLSARGVIDLNGPKGPNVLGRDLRTFNLRTVKFVSSGTNIAQGGNVATEANPNIEVPFDNPCAVGDDSEDCCQLKLDKGLILNVEDPCCRVPKFDNLPGCAADIELVFDSYPSNPCTIPNWSDCDPHSRCQKPCSGPGTKATKDGKEINTLPADPPPVYMFCSGKYAGQIPSSVVKNLVLNQPSYDYPIEVTSENIGASCGYVSGSGIGTKGISLVFKKDGETNKTRYNGINWAVRYY